MVIFEMKDLPTQSPEPNNQLSCCIMCIPFLHKLVMAEKLQSLIVGFEDSMNQEKLNHMNKY